MRPTAYPVVNELLNDLLAEMRPALGDKLVGVYLTGSLAIGDFGERISDVDLVIALSSDPDDVELAALRVMHDMLAKRYPAWSNRIEGRYLSVTTLNDPGSAGNIVSISPGEPFNVRPSSIEWLMDWYVAREHGITLYGSPPREVIRPITRDAYVDSIKAACRAWGTQIERMRRPKQRAYAIIAMCRALYSCQTGEQISKPRAARWGERELPEWAPLIRRAVAWREGPDDAPPDEASYAETARFVAFARARVALSS